MSQARTFVSIHAYTLGRVEPRPDEEITRELARGEAAQWPCFRTLHRLRLAAGDLLLCSDHSTSIAKSREVAAHKFIASGAGVWVSIDEDIEGSADDVAMLLEAARDPQSDVIIAPCTLRDGSRLNVHTRERSLRQAGSARVFRVDGGGLALAAFTRETIRLMASRYSELCWENPDSQEAGIGIFLEMIRGHRRWGEDYAFCTRARAVGLHLEALCDSQVRHMGVAACVSDDFLSEPPTQADSPGARKREA